MYQSFDHVSIVIQSIMRLFKGTHMQLIKSGIPERCSNNIILKSNLDQQDFLEKEQIYFQIEKIYY